MVRFNRSQATMRVSIIGSRTRNRDDAERCRKIVGYAFRWLDKRKDTIISGGAMSGADHWADFYSNLYGFRFLEAKAFWSTPAGHFDKSAGFKRNQTIIDECDCALVVWDGKSSGTANSIELLNKSGKPYWTVQL